MTAIRVIIMRESKTHTANDEAGRYEKGEAVDVFIDDGGRRLKNVHPSFDTIYVPDFPGTLDQAKDVLLEQHRNTITNDLVSRRKRVLDELTVSQARDLSNNGNITITRSELNTRTRIRETNKR